MKHIPLPTDTPEHRAGCENQVVSDDYPSSPQPAENQSHEAGHAQKGSKCGCDGKLDLKKELITSRIRRAHGHISIAHFVNFSRTQTEGIKVPRPKGRGFNPQILMKLTDTRIEHAGVMRCCLATVAEEYHGKDVKIGDKSQCRHCKEPFFLTDKKPHPKWIPDWQFESNQNS
jgi:hypothetical protein